MRWSVHTELTSDYAALIATRKLGEDPANNRGTYAAATAATREGRGDVAQQAMFHKDWLDINFFRGLHSSLTSLNEVIVMYGSLLRIILESSL